jgi:RNA polymerase-binding transcription factor DksA
MNLILKISYSQYFKLPGTYSPANVIIFLLIKFLYLCVLLNNFRIMADKTRYSDAELEEFREIILAKLDKAKKDYEILKSSITHEESNDTMDTSPTFKVLEEGATTLSKEEAGRLAQRQLKFIQHLQAALIRIENKTYGICRETGNLISKERLRAVPHATLSMDAKMKQK